MKWNIEKDKLQDDIVEMCRLKCVYEWKECYFSNMYMYLY